jgi:methyl-accepting chemotaxis protein WspA
MRNRITSWLNNLSIKQKLYYGFGTVLVFLLVVVLVTMINLLIVRSKINTMVEQNEPTVLAAMELGQHLKEATGALGFYLLSKEQTHKKAYQDAQIKIDEVLAELRQYKPVQENADAQALVTSLESDIGKFKQYQTQMFELAEDNSKNIPGIRFAAENLNPISQQVLQNLYSMIQTESEEDATARRKNILLDIESLRYNWTNVMNGIRAYLAYRTDTGLEQIEIYREQSDALIAKLNNYQDDLTLDQLDSLERIASLKDKFYINLEELKEIHSGKQWRRDAHLIRAEIGPILDSANEKLIALQEMQRENINEANDSLVTNVASTIIIGIALLISAVLAAGWLAMQLIKAIIQPMNAAVEATGRIAAGDLTVTLEETSRDEIGELMVALNMMVANLAGLVSQVQQSGIQVTSSSTEIAATAKQQEATVTEQAATGNQITTTAKEIAATVQELVNTMDEVTGVAETTANSAINSQTALSSMEKTMHQMMEATSSIGSKLSVLSEKASNINSVVTTITKVADQTNLLSLNAAIEAEKAGEYGVGFSVVATEIRRLADQTAVATWDIEQMVKEMQSAVSAGVMGMDKFTEEVRRGVDEVRHVGAQLAAIIDEVRNLLPRFETVHEGMQNQAQGARQITESIVQLSDGAQQTAESLRQSNGAIGQLRGAAHGLQESVSKFKVNTG